MRRQTPNGNPLPPAHHNERRIFVDHQPGASDVQIHVGQQTQIDKGNRETYCLLTTVYVCSRL